MLQVEEIRMKIAREEVEHVASLARLELEPAELAALTSQLDAILGYVEKLNQLDTEGIVPTAYAVPMENAFRADETKGSIGIERALQNAPATDGPCFKVPKVIE